MRSSYCHGNGSVNNDENDSRNSLTIFMVIQLILSYSFTTIPNNNFELFNFSFIVCPFRDRQKLPMSRIFHLNMAGYWLKFSTSNNRTSLVGHELRYCHCAKLIIVVLIKTLIYLTRLDLSDKLSSVHSDKYRLLLARFSNMLSRSNSLSSVLQSSIIF